ncbi:MAG: metallophosphoesterase [Clostridia bacterium]|nr:metallophosphoesterase [Clostridia bacterium]
MKPLDVAILTDTHYYSKKNWVDGDPYAFPAAREQLYRRGSEEIIRYVFDSLCEEGQPEIILISGDLTNNGENTSHEEMRELLRSLKARGKRVYVTTATHDYRGEGVSYGFDKNNRKVDVPAFQREDLRAFYQEFGRSEAVSVHEATMSYAVDLTPEYRLLALNDDKGYDHAGFTDECFDWIAAQIADAKEKGMYVFAMTHHPVLSPSPLYRLIASGDLLENGEARAKQFADLGVCCMLTGHSHIHNTSCIRSEKGNAFYDVSTSALVGFPPYYRRLRFEPDDGRIDVSTVCIDAVPGLDTDGLSLPEFTKKQFLGTVGDVLRSAEQDYETFIRLADGFSLREEKARKLRWIIRPAAKTVNHLTFGKIWRLSGSKRCGVTKREIALIKDKPVVPFVLDMAANLYRGDAALDKRCVEYRVACGFFRLCDTLSKPFSAKLRGAGIDSVSEMLLPLVHKDGLPDANYVIRFEN